MNTVSLPYNHVLRFHLTTAKCSAVGQYTRFKRHRQSPVSQRWSRLTFPKILNRKKNHPHEMKSYVSHIIRHMHLSLQNGTHWTDLIMSCSKTAPLFLSRLRTIPNSLFEREAEGDLFSQRRASNKGR